MNSNPAASYLNTELVFNLPEHGAWVLRPEGVGANPPAHFSMATPTGALSDYLGLQHPAFVVTAANPRGNRLDPKLNELRNTRLHWALRDLGLEAIPCIGRSLDGDHSEPSFWVPSFGTPGIAMSAEYSARKFDQNAIFKVAGGEMGLVGVLMPELGGSRRASWWQAS